MDGERKLMVAALAQRIQDYVNAKGESGDRLADEIESLERDIKKQTYLYVERSETGKLHRRKRAVRRGVEAEHYIFDNNEESNNYVFGFNFICKTIGLDPNRFRRKIKELRQEKIREFRIACRTR